MNKSRLINSLVVVNLTLALVWPQTSLAFSLFGPSDAEKNILFLQGYNAGIARTIATDEAQGLPVPTRTNVKIANPLVATNASSTYVTNPLSGDLNLNQWTVSNGNVHLNSATTGYNPLSVGAFGARAVAFRANATNTDAFAGKFEGNVDIDHGMLTINNPYSYSVTTPPTASVGLGVSGNYMGIFSLSYGSAEDSVGVLGRGVNGVKGEAAYGNGKAIWGVTWPDEYPNSYAGYFDGRVVVTDGLRTTKLCVGNNLEDTGACLQNEGIISTAANDSIVGNALSNSGTGVLGQGFKGVYGRAVGDNSIGIYGAVASGATNALAARFDGETEISAGNLNFSNNLNPRIDVNNNVYSTLGINFSYNPSTGRMDDWGIDSLSDFTFTSDNRLGIGTAIPNANLHIKTVSGNAEVDIQSGGNTHWGIYQASTGGALNFWHGDNRLSINDKGITTKGICLGTVCVTKWEDLKTILNPTPAPTKSGVVPVQQ